MDRATAFISESFTASCFRNDGADYPYKVCVGTPPDAMLCNLAPPARPMTRTTLNRSLPIHGDAASMSCRANHTVCTRTIKAGLYLSLSIDRVQPSERTNIPSRD